MKILVGSVYADNERTDQWYNLQISQLQKTTDDFDHVVYAYCDNSFPHSETIRSTSTPTGGQQAHIQGLTTILQHFKQTNAEHFLLLDSDCFPIKPWANRLLSAMGQFEVAAATRCENLDTFAHPCAFFFKKSVLDKLKFNMNPITNLVGENHVEVSPNVQKFFPLLRTNQTNDHPILYGVYWDIFYHHGAGSRSLDFRAFDNGYYEPVSDLQNMEKMMFDNLVNNPERFIQRLTTRKISKTKMY